MKSEEIIVPVLAFPTTFATKILTTQVSDLDFEVEFIA